MAEKAFVEAPQTTESKSFDWPKMVLIAVLGLALLAGAAYAGYWYGTESAKLPPEADRPLVDKTLIPEIPTPEPTPTPPQTTSPTAGWKTYTNKTYRYSIMYPAEYYSDAGKGIEESFSIWNYDMRTKRGDEPLKEGEFKLDILRSGVLQAEETPLEYIKRLNPDVSGANVDRGPFLEYKFAAVEGYISESTGTIWVENNSNVFYVNTYTSSPAEKTNQILSTFKFLE